MAKKEEKKKAKSLNLKPLGDRVIISAIKNSAKETSSGIYIPDTVKEDKGTKKGKVVAVGDGKFDDGKQIPMKVKVGDTVLFQWGDDISYNGEEYTVVREGEILAIIS